MRAMLEKTISRRIKVAAILLTHWHYANGILPGSTRERSSGGTSVSMPIAKSSSG